MTEDVDWQAINNNCAGEHAVSPAVHPEDLLWQFIQGHVSFPEPSDVASYYFADGARSAHKLARLVLTHLPAAAAGEPYSLLEFASGYGMVTRHLRNALPGAEVTSCDIHMQAIDFIRDELSGTAVRSGHLPEDLAFDAEFDVVFALSFFSHMPERSFGSWLAALFRVVKPGGVLVFTTHGLGSRPSLGNPEIPENGFWFIPSSEQHDLDGAEYGSTISTPEFVIRELFRHVRAPLAEFRSSYWWGHQDLYVVAKAG